ncbi:aldo/keto reductase [Sphingobacterium sp. MYb388]|uniref:aldo/keto reductase n=1 Tax=Sphingobacterium sp. MYb388 TaxID=2745437 RepID=UPI0030AB80F3
MTTYTLNNGIKIPAIGFGTWQIEDGAPAYNAVAEALNAGYIHIDTAAVYGNEKVLERPFKIVELIVMIFLLRQNYGTRTVDMKTH